jgi:hypothetical protein
MRLGSKCEWYVLVPTSTPPPPSPNPFDGWICRYVPGPSSLRSLAGSLCIFVLAKILPPGWYCPPFRALRSRCLPVSSRGPAQSVPLPVPPEGFAPAHSACLSPRCPSVFADRPPDRCRPSLSVRPPERCAPRCAARPSRSALWRALPLSLRVCACLLSPSARMVPCPWARVVPPFLPSPSMSALVCFLITNVPPGWYRNELCLWVLSGAQIAGAYFTSSGSLFDCWLRRVRIGPSPFLSL